MRRFFSGLVAGLDWFTRGHFVWFTLGIPTLLAGIVSGMLWAFTAFPPWSQILIALGVFIVALGVVGVVVGRLTSYGGSGGPPHRHERIGRFVRVSPKQRYYKNAVIRLTDLEEGEPARITDRTLEDCDLYGPAVVHVLPSTHVERPTFCVDHVEDAFFQPSREGGGSGMLTGVLVMRDSIVRGCRFHDVSILATASDWVRDYDAQSRVRG